MSESRKKIGLVLGSGVARVLAHIGVIDALNELDVKIDMIAGTSMGALVGSIYSAGKLDRLKENALQLDWHQLLHFFDIIFPRSGIIDGKKIADFIHSHVEEVDIRDLLIPFCAVATDLREGRQIVIDQGDLIEAVRASISVPGIFTPVKKDKELLVDGALVNPVPVSVAKDMGADLIIAVDVNYGTGKIPMKVSEEDESGNAVSEESRDKEKKEMPLSKWETELTKLGTGMAILEFMTRSKIDRWLQKDHLPSIFEILLYSYNVLEVQITEMHLKDNPPDVLIRPDVSDIRGIEFDRAEEAIEEGYSATMDLAGELANL